MIKVYKGRAPDKRHHELIVRSQTMQIAQAESVAEDGKVTKYRFGPTHAIEPKTCQLLISGGRILNPFIDVSGTDHPGFKLLQTPRGSVIGHVPEHVHNEAYEWVLKQDQVWIDIRGQVHDIELIPGPYSRNIVSYLGRRYGKYGGVLIRKLNKQSGYQEGQRKAEIRYVDGPPIGYYGPKHEHPNCKFDLDLATKVRFRPGPTDTELLFTMWMRGQDIGPARYRTGRYSWHKVVDVQPGPDYELLDKYTQWHS